MLFKTPYKSYEIWIGRSFTGLNLIPRYTKEKGSINATWMGVTVVIASIRERTKKD